MPAALPPNLNLVPASDLQRIQLSRAAGWRMPPNTVKVDRTTRWGNPFRAELFGAARAVALYENALHGVWSPTRLQGEPPELVEKAYAIHLSLRAYLRRSYLGELRGKNLACWCRVGAPCHADALLRHVLEGRH